MWRIHIYGFFTIVRYLTSDQLYSFISLAQEVITNLIQVTIIVGCEYAFLIALNFRLCDHQRGNGTVDYFIANILQMQYIYRNTFIIV